MAKNTDRTILVTGATGHQGGAVFRKLRDRGFPVRAFTRDPERAEAGRLVGHGAEVMRGDLDDPASITRALDGVYGVFSVQAHSELGAEAELRQGKNLIDAARRSRVTQFVYSSAARADQHTGIPFFESKAQIEEHLRNSGVRYAILRPTFFMENWMWQREQIETGTLALPLSPATRIPMIAVDDIGAFAALAFERPGHWQGRAVEIAGDELSMQEIAEAFTLITGHDVRYQQVPWDLFEQKAGPEMTKMYRWFEEHYSPVDTGALRSEHSGLMGFARWLQAKWLKTQTAG